MNTTTTTDTAVPVLVRTGYVTAVVRAPGCDLTALGGDVDRMLPGGWQSDTATDAVVDPDVRIDVHRTSHAPSVAITLDRQVRVALRPGELSHPTVAYVIYTVAEAARQHRGLVTVHASAVLDPAGRAVLLLGDKGAGKTGTLLALIERGYRVLGDDLIMLSISTVPATAPGRVAVLPGRRRGAVRQPDARLGYETKRSHDFLVPELDPATGLAGWPLAAVVRVSVHTAAAAPVVTDPAPLSLAERLRLAENLARYITGTPTPLALEPDVHAPVYPLDTLAASATRSRLITCLGELGVRYLNAPTFSTAAALLAALPDLPSRV